MKKLLLIVQLLLFICLNSFSQIYVNEFSNGPSGTKEYVELLVANPSTCNNPCIDIRGWIIDDNNGFHSPTTSGAGIASGCIRFPYIAQWSCVKQGTLIVIYHQADKNAKIPADDSTDANGDNVYILAGNSKLLEINDSLPSVGSQNYPTTGFSNVGVKFWSTIGFANAFDCFQIISPSNNTISYHSVGYVGASGAQNGLDVFFTQTGSGSNFYIDQCNSLADYRKQSSWLSGLAPLNETPGTANSVTNANFINSLLNPIAIVPIKLSASITPSDSSLCTGAIFVTVTQGNGTPYTYTWQTTPLNFTDSITNRCAGEDTIRISDARGCIFDTVITVPSETPQGINSIELIHNEQIQKNEIILTPLSINGKLKIQSSVEIKFLTLFDSFGKTIFSKSVTNSEEIIDITQFGDGIYFAKFTLINDKIILRKLLFGQAK